MRTQTVSHIDIIETDYFLSHGRAAFLMGFSKYADVNDFYAKWFQPKLDAIAHVIPYPEDMYWCSMFLWVKEYYENNGKFPQAIRENRFVYALGRWRLKQRDDEKDQKLTPKQSALLDSISLEWRQDKSDEWEQSFTQAKKFYAKNGRLPGFAKVGSEERRLRTWIERQKECRTPERRERLDEAIPGWSETELDRWFAKLQKVADFSDLNGRYPLATITTPDEERSLGNWLKSNRADFKKNPGKFNTEQIAALNEKVPGWSASYGDHWNVTLQEVTAYIAANDDLPSVNDRGTHASLGKWIQTQRENIENLSPDQISALDAAVPYWSETPDQKWQRRLGELVMYVSQNNDFPSDKGDNKKIGSWYQVQKRKSNKDELSEDRKAALDTAVPHWDDPWKFKLHKLAAHVQQHGKVPSTKHTVEELKQMGLWAKRQRDNAKKSNLTKDQERELDRLIPDWR